MQILQFEQAIEKMIGQGVLPADFNTSIVLPACDHHTLRYAAGTIRASEQEQQAIIWDNFGRAFVALPTECQTSFAFSDDGQLITVNSIPLVHRAHSYDIRL